MSILIADNISVQEKWSKSVDVPKGVIVDRIIGFFTGRFNVTLHSGDENQSLEVVSGTPFLVTIDIKDSCEIVIEPIEGTVKINQLSLTIVDLPKPEKEVDVSKIKIIHHPEQDVIIALDFTEMLKEIKDVPFPQIEILNPDNTRFVINQSSEIFQWRKDTYLYCKLTVGERQLRVKFVENQPWSAWWTFICLSKKRYRLLKNT